jgi:predicted O-methyltransferase YrrM
MIKTIRNFYNKYFLNYFKEIIVTQKISLDTLAMQQLVPFSNAYVPWSDSALRPSAIVTVLNEILINNRNCIVECGGGVSTFYIARLLKERGGHLFTIEHEERWANLLNQRLEEENLDQFVTIIIAPLRASELALNENDWYDINILNKELINKSIDLLLIDGPPAFQEKIKYARYPAVPYFYTLMAEDYTIILDDIDREGENEIVIKWETYLNLSFERRFLKGNIAIGKKSRFTV